MKRYNILHTIETGGPGGAETVLLELASRLNSDRFRSWALLPGGHWLPQQLASRGVPVIIASSKAWYDTTLIRALARTVRENKIDLIQSHLADQNFYSCLAGRYTGSSTIVTYHGMMGFSEGRSYRSKIKSWVVRKYASAVVVVSDYLKRKFQVAGFAPEKIQRIYNGIDFGRFEKGTQTDLRAELNLGPGSKLVGMVANLRRAKGYPHFVAAARIIANHVPEARFLAVGEPDPAIERELREQIHQLGLDKEFLLLGFRPDVPAVLKDLDVFVLSSTDEGLSIATIEAMAAGKPVVVTRSGGPEEIVTEGKTGFLVPPGDPSALAMRVCDLLREPELGSRLGNTAKAEARANFSVSRMISEYESLYLRCLNAD